MRKKFNIFKILEGKERVINNTGRTQQVRYTYDGTKPLYETSDIAEAYNMFERMISEGYRDNMMLILDFGIMGRKQRNRCNRNGNKFDCDFRIEDLIPYLNIGEFHKVDRRYNGYWNHTLTVEGNCNTSHLDGDTYKTIKFFINNYTHFSLSLNLYYDIEDEYGDVYTKVRTIATTDLLLDQRKYNGCKKIVMDRSIRNRRKVQRRSEVLLLECNNDQEEEDKIEVVSIDDYLKEVESSIQ